MRSSIYASLAVFAAVVDANSKCAYESCFFKDSAPKNLKPVISAFCNKIVRPQTTTITGPPSTKTATATVTATASTSVVPVTVTSSTTKTIICTTTSTVSPSTFINYPTVVPVSSAVKRDAETESLHVRDFTSVLKNLGYPDFCDSGCKKKPTLDAIKRACQCFLNKVTVTVTPTAASTVTVTAPGGTVTSFSTSTANPSVETCGASTSIAVVTGVGPCGPATLSSYTATTTGSKTCAADAAPAGETNFYYRLEGNDADGTIFDDCISTGPRMITTPSGGTHQCGSTSTGSLSTALADVAEQNGFTFDGSFSSSFNDYFITRIANTQQGGNSYWGVLNNGVFTTTGGCGATVSPGDVGLWQWDAFNLQSLLTVSPAYAVVQAGQGTVSVAVTQRSPNGGASSPAVGASFAGATTDGSGVATFNVPAQPGCYQYKATRDRSGRSNAFYLNVVSSFAPA